ncbi:methionine synthase ii cobalamin-independent [Trichoderma arundinaceum]|uniref:Methionine synthase ii cobalamin-independent n=1 Tax=Trichoderma arundinaceum TaxID=490622 RepID=A0A395NAE4_TRIAR|nr:methionine synthase ii cobalamin-independent [Trichoderma arundinaceum]
MPIPTEVVGSLPRPTYLQQAFADYDAGKITHDDLVAAQDKAAKDSVERMQAAGETYVTDGEQRASSFATYPIVETLKGAGLPSNFAADGQFFAIFDDGHHRQLPRLVSGPFKYATYAWQNLKKSKPYASNPMKQAVIAPSMMYLLYPLQGELEGYPRDVFIKDLIDECEKDIRGCFETGAKRVSIDFTEGIPESGRLALKHDPKNPWTNAELLERFILLINQVLDRFTPEERINIGLHTCPGGDCDSVHSAEVDYSKLLPSLFQINAGYFLIELSSERNREAVYKLIGQHIRKDAKGVKQVAFIGVINTLNPKVERPEDIADQLVLASQHIPPDQLGATDDCGFSPFSIDVKPSHGSPDFARDIAFQKISSRVQGAKLASERLGV